MEPMGLFALPDHLSRLSKTGDPVEVLDQVVDFEQFREPLERALGYAGGSKGGRPPYDPVVMFKILILAARHTVSDERMEFLIRDRLSWLRFLGFDLGAPTPDRNTIWTFRERLTKAGAIDDLFVAFEGALRAAGYLPMGGQIVDATLVSAPRQRLTRAEKEAAQAGEPAVSVWADTAYRPAANEAWLADLGRVSRIHRKKPPGRPMPRHLARGNASKSAVRAYVEHVFAHQKERMGLFVRTIGLDRVRTRTGLANLAYNFQRLVFHERRAAAA